MRTFVRDDSLPWVGSVSALRCLADCPQAFQNKYIKKLERDSDWVRPKFFAFGSAAHTALELCKHDVSKLTTQDIKGISDGEGLKWQTDGAKLAACLRAYGSKARPMQVLAVEQELIGQNWVIYVDAILADETHWFMCDTKFVASFEDEKILKQKLKRDNQLWLYMSANQKIAIELGIPTALEFGGFLYREVQKPAIKAKKVPETWEEFTLRCGTPAYRETHIEWDKAICAENVRNMNVWLSVARNMKPSDIVARNYNNCISQTGVVCESYSKCRGVLYSSLKAEKETEE
jgi:hypothetical protein